MTLLRSDGGRTGCGIRFMKYMFDSARRARHGDGGRVGRSLAVPCTHEARLARVPVALMLVSLSRTAWMSDLALWIGELKGDAVHLSAQAVCPRWLQENLWALKTTAPGANFLIVEDGFAAGLAGTAELLWRVRAERPDLVVLLVAQEASGLGRQHEGICDGILALPVSRPAFRKELGAAEARHARAMASCAGSSPRESR